MIYTEITDDYHFWNWLKQSDNYSNNFSLEGAKALQAYLDELSEEVGLGEQLGMSFDPIAWCCAWSEYDSYKQAYEDITGDTENVDKLQGDDYEAYFMDKTTALTLDNGHCLIEEF
jgi:hypothetical protein